MILSKVQAEGVAKALSEINNLGMFLFEVDAASFRFKVTQDGVRISGGEDDYSVEDYACQFDFCSAYGLI